MPKTRFFERYCELQAYVDWTEDDAARVVAIKPLLEPYLRELVDDFYAAIGRNPNAQRAITGGQEQIERLKGTLILWLEDLLSGRYDVEYVDRRRKVGKRHVDIGLEQVYTNVALSRLRSGMIRLIQDKWSGSIDDQRAAVRSLNKLLDLDLAIIEDAYQNEYSQKLQRTERLAALGQVAGGVAHELRNPLNVVKTSVYYLLNAKNATAEKKIEHLKRIERHVDLADNVISVLSSFAKQSAPRLTPVDMAELTRETLASNPVDPAVTVVVDHPDGETTALADSDQLRIVLGNLIRNASDAMERSTDRLLKIRLVRLDGAVEVEVSDTGVGIESSKLERIMEPLYTTKARGLGLGLAIARAILDKNQGSLRVLSEPGKGSTFTVRLAAPRSGTARESSDEA